MNAVNWALYLDWAARLLVSWIPFFLLIGGFALAMRWMPMSKWCKCGAAAENATRTNELLERIAVALEKNNKVA